MYEQKSWLGGNLGSRLGPDGEHLDVYPHMYLEWYHNFWALLQEVTEQPKEARFVPSLRSSSCPRVNSRGSPRSPTCTRPGTSIQNLFSGVGPPADMFVFGYASIDLLAERFNPTMTLDNVDVNAFLNTRPYMTKRGLSRL